MGPAAPCSIASLAFIFPRAHRPFLESRSPTPLTPRYWGKRDTKLILPTNSSLSVTLDQDHLRSTTTSRADASFEKDRLWLNGKEEVVKEGGRLWTCINELRAWRREEEKQHSDLPRVSVASEQRKEGA